MKKNHSGLNRRHFLGGLGASGLFLSGHRRLEAADTRNVIVLGAGLAGLNAALNLQQQGCKVTVLEAADQVGGRVQTRNFAGNRHELGAGEIGVMYARVLDMARQLDLDLVPTPPSLRGYSYNIGGKMLDADDWETSELNKTVGDERAVLPSGLEGSIVRRLNPLKETDDWLQESNQSLDVPFDSYLRSQGVSEEAIRLIGQAYNGPGMNRTSALAMFRNATRFDFGMRAFLTMQEAGIQVAPLRRIKGGNQRLPEAMAAALDHEVNFKQQAALVDQDANGVQVTCMDGSRYRADFLVSAIPLPALKSVNFMPALSVDKAAAAAQISYYQTTKFYLRPTQPFWENDGYEPTMWTDSAIERVFAAQDSNDNVHTLLVWINGQGAQRIDRLGEAAGKQFVLDTLAKLRPASKGKLEVVGYHAWGRTPHIGGCGANYSAGQIRRFSQPLVAAEGRIHFAGEHTRRTEHGMESAMASGERAAIEILSAGGG
jgi:monoamine oxidase